MPQPLDSSDIVIPAYYVVKVINQLNLYNIDPTKQLAKLNISPQQLNNKDGMVSPWQMAMLMQFCAKQLDDEFLGVFEHKTPTGFIKFLLRHMLDSDDLASCIMQGSEFINQFSPSFNLFIHKADKQIKIEVVKEEPGSDKTQFATELFSAIFLRILNWMINEQIQLQHAEFDYSEPEHLHFYPLMFNCPHSFNRSITQFTFSSEYLTRKLRKTKHNLHLLLHTFPLTLFLRPGEIRSTIDEVSSIVFTELIKHSKMLTITQVAGILNTSEPTLRRKLNNELTSYQQIKDQIRNEIASDLLINHNDKISLVAQRVGFEEPNNFIRAFKSWNGVSPSEFRKHHS